MESSLVSTVETKACLPSILPELALLATVVAAGLVPMQCSAIIGAACVITVGLLARRRHPDISEPFPRSSKHLESIQIPHPSIH